MLMGSINMNIISRSVICWASLYSKFEKNSAFQDVWIYPSSGWETHPRNETNAEPSQKRNA